MQIVNILATVPVGDHEAAVAWYAQLFGRAADSAPMVGLAEWHFSSGGIQVTGDAEHAGAATVTLVVADIAAAVEALTARGCDVGAISAGAISRFAPLRDLDGNTLMLAELSAAPVPTTEEIEDRG